MFQAASSTRGVKNDATSRDLIDRESLIVGVNGEWKVIRGGEARIGE